MRILAVNFVIFLGFAFLFSSCGSQPVPENNTPANTASTDEQNTDSKYPPLPEKIAQAEMENLDRTTTKIADQKGKVLLLNLWATWCGFCREEMPILVKMQNEHRDAGFEILGLNVDDEPIDKVNEFAAEMKLNYPLMWSDESTTRELLKVSKFQGIPQSFLVDRAGNLRGVFTGADPRNLKKMEKLVAEIVAEESSL
jgi:thiol-disulfide isomerase/thioredoxin